MPGWLIGFVPERADNAPNRLVVYYNPERTAQWVDLPGGRWRTLCDGTRAQARPFGPERTGHMELPPVSVVILAARKD